MRAVPLRLLCAGTAGVAAGLSFEPFGLAYLLPFAVAGATLAVLGARVAAAAAAGTAFGLAFMLVLLPWLQVIGADAWVMLALLEGLFYGIGGVLTVLVARLPWWPVWAAAGWVAVELLRGTVPFGGFPWGRLVFATIDTPVAPAIAVVGPAGGSFLVALVGTTLAWAVRAGRGRSVLDRLAAVAAVVALAAAWVALPVGTGAGTDRAPFTVAAVQGDVPGEGMTAFAERRVVLENHVAATLALAERVEAGRVPAPDLVIWPENSTDIDPFTDPSVHADIQAAVDAVGVPVLVGAMVGGARPDEVYNQGIVWEPGTGPGQRYAKVHPVPFGEYIPFRDQLAHYFDRLDQIPRDMVPGDRPGVLRMNGVTLADVICFEVAYDDVVRAAVTPATDLLVVQTNNATYMGTGQVEQQFAIARLRALETGRTVVVAATNGVSGIVGPDGQVVQRAPVRTRAVLVEQVPPPAGTPPARATAPWVQAGLVAVAAVSALAGVRTGYRRRARRDQPARGTASVEA